MHSEISEPTKTWQQRDLERSAPSYRYDCMFNKGKKARGQTAIIELARTYARAFNAQYVDRGTLSLPTKDGKCAKGVRKWPCCEEIWWDRM